MAQTSNFKEQYERLMSEGLPNNYKTAQKAGCSKPFLSVSPRLLELAVRKLMEQQDIDCIIEIEAKGNTESIDSFLSRTKSGSSLCKIAYETGINILREELARRGLVFSRIFVGNYEMDYAIQVRPGENFCITSSL